MQRIIEVMAELVAYVDGGCLGNPGPSGIGVVINGCADGPVRIAKWIGHQDNNVAEYAALMEALQYAVSLKARKLHVYSDSEVVVRQMTGEYQCRSPRLYSLHWTCRKLARSLKFSISHVPREDNAEANGLAQSALRRLCRERASNVLRWDLLATATLLSWYFRVGRILTPCWLRARLQVLHPL